MQKVGLIILSVCLSSGGLAGASWAEPPPPADEDVDLPTVQRTLQGEVLDPGAFLRDGRRGPEQIDQTYEAVDGGQTLALLEDRTGILYLLLADSPGEDPSGLVYDHVNQKVAVTGRVYERGGLRGIVAALVEPVETPDAAPAPTDP